MPRLPVPGTDNENWGGLLNEFLRVAHRDDGTHTIPDTTYWTSAIGAITTDPTVGLVRGQFGDTLEVYSSTLGDLKWINFPLFLPSDRAIKKVLVCYQLTSSLSFISQVRLSEETLPPSALVVHDDGTDLTSTSATMYESIVGNLGINGALTLSLRLNFGDTNARIKIGALGIVLGAAA
jgi:hypothetical protein